MIKFMIVTLSSKVNFVLFFLGITLANIHTLYIVYTLFYLNPISVHLGNIYFSLNLVYRPSNSNQYLHLLYLNLIKAILLI